MPHLTPSVVLCSICAMVSGCVLFGGSFEPTPTGPLAPLAPPPELVGPLSLRITYPRAEDARAGAGQAVAVRSSDGYSIQSSDSAFVFGSVGRGDASLSINGVPVSVYSSGAWLAWLALPDDTVASFDVVAAAGTDTARVTMTAPIAGHRARHLDGLWIDSTSLAPTGDIWVRPGEGVRLSVSASPGAAVTGRTGGGDAIRFLPDTSPSARPWGELAFSTDILDAGTPSAPTDRYVAWWTGRLGPDPDIVMAPDFIPAAADSAWLELEAALGNDTVRSRWPLRIGVADSREPILVVVNDDMDGVGNTDGILAGRPSPWGTYQWFFPNGTIARVSGRRNDQVRLQLSSTSSAWVDESGVYPLPPGTPPPVGVARSLRLAASETSVVLRIPLPGHVPFQMEESGRRLDVRLYGVAADMDWIQYGEADSFVQLIEFAQPREDEAVISITLSTPLWGYRTRWNGNDLCLEIRYPPDLDPQYPLEGRRIAVDAGHPPGGAIGPTGTPESEVTLEVAKKLARLLREHGAQPVMIRDSEAPLGLYERIEIAEAADAELMVSIHANALPDGVNPFVNNGTSVYFFYPRSVGLARQLNRALVRQFGFRDLGIGRGNLALVRTTWMPAALTEGLFMMLPDQEAVLVSEEGQWRYARGVLEGIALFLREWALDAR